MSLFVMTRQRYEILCHLLNGAKTPGDLQAIKAVQHRKTMSLQVIALRNAGLIERRGFRAPEGGRRPTLYGLTELGESAILGARVPLAAKGWAFVDLADLQVPA